MALRALRACLILLAAAVGAAAAASVIAPEKAEPVVADTARLPASFDARDAFYGCADIVLDQARPGASGGGDARSAMRKPRLRLLLIARIAHAALTRRGCAGAVRQLLGRERRVSAV